MSILYVIAAIAASIVIRNGWRRGVREAGFFLPALLLSAACNIGDASEATVTGCGDLPCDAGTGGASATTTTTTIQCMTQDPTCPTFPNAVACRFYAGGPCQFSACAKGWENCNGQIQDGCEVEVTTDPGNCGGCGMTCDSGVCEMGVCK